MSQDLWAGADVVWTGPELTRDDIRVSPGDRAVVVDAGRHHVSSFGALARGRLRRGRLRRGHGVTIRIDGRAEVDVPRQHLRVVAPDHLLQPEPDRIAADWTFVAGSNELIRDLHRNSVLETRATRHDASANQL